MWYAAAEMTGEVRPGETATVSTAAVLLTATVDIVAWLSLLFTFGGGL